MIDFLLRTALRARNAATQPTAPFDAGAITTAGAFLDTGTEFKHESVAETPQLSNAAPTTGKAPTTDMAPITDTALFANAPRAVHAAAVVEASAAAELTRTSVLAQAVATLHNLGSNPLAPADRASTAIPQGPPLPAMFPAAPGDETAISSVRESTAARKATHANPLDRHGPIESVAPPNGPQLEFPAVTHAALRSWIAERRSHAASTVGVARRVAGDTQATPRPASLDVPAVPSSSLAQASQTPRTRTSAHSLSDTPRSTGEPANTETLGAARQSAAGHTLPLDDIVPPGNAQPRAVTAALAMPPVPAGVGPGSIEGSSRRESAKSEAVAQVSRSIRQSPFATPPDAAVRVDLRMIPPDSLAARPAPRLDRAPSTTKESLLAPAADAVQITIARVEIRASGPVRPMPLPRGAAPSARRTTLERFLEISDSGRPS